LVAEPELSYAVKKNKIKAMSITISSIKEQEESNYEYWIGLTPEQRWAEHFKLLQGVYGKEKKKLKTVDRIIFD